MKKQNKVKCTTCQDTKTRCGGAGQCDHDGSECFSDGRNCGEYSPEIPCPDCTAPQPMDEEIKPLNVHCYISNISTVGDKQGLILESDVRKLEAKLKEQADEIERLRKREEAVFSHLSMYGVKRERARTVPNGIEVLMTRIRKEQMCTSTEINTLSSLLSEAVEGLDDLLGNAMELYTYYPNNFRKNKDEYFKEDLALLAKLEQFTND